ncbi:MAG: DUF3467 domain-containing protein [Tepidisphaeraceae bacterium]|jgi:uncharacterized protein DUF3467
MSEFFPPSGGGSGGEAGQPPENQPPQEGAVGNLGAHSQQFSHHPVAARVPERVARGGHATGVIVLDSPTEFVMDFLQGLTRPYQIVSRIIVHPLVMGQIAKAMQENLNNYNQAFGSPPPMPAPPQRRPTIQEIYENFKLPDELLSGVYANSVVIGHSRAEFYLDFITGFYPTAAVSSRIFLSSYQAPRILETLTMALQQHQKRYTGGQQQQGEGNS